MNKILVALLFTIISSQLHAMFPRIEEITRGYAPNYGGNLQINAEQKVLLQKIADSKSPQVPREELQSFLETPYVTCLANFAEIKDHILTSEHRQHDGSRVNQFIDENKYNMRDIKHVCGIDLLYEITQALVTHEL